MIRVAGYPRSGNFFVLHALKLMYEEQTVGPFHNTKVLTLTDPENQTFVVFRNPADCIAAWFEYDDRGTHALGIEADIAYYLRYTQAVLDTAENHTVLDFDKFKSDFDYLARKVGKQPVVMPTMEDVRDSLRKEGNEVNNLPDPSRYANRELTKAAVVNDPKFAEALALYNQLKALEQSK